MKIILRLLLIFILLVGMFNVSYSVYAEDEDTSDSKDEDEEDETKTLDESEDEKEKKAYERELEVEKESDKFKIKSESKVGENKDKIEIEFKTEDEVELEFKYKVESESLESELKYEVSISQIIEYDDSGVADNGYQEGEEIFEYDIKDVDWKPIAYTTEVIGGGIVNVITAETDDGVFKMIMRISESVLDLQNGATLTPNSLKIDIEIHDFPYTQNGTSLALKSKIKTESEFKVENDTAEEQSGFAVDESQIAIGAGFFSWAETAFADGTEVPVIASSLKETNDDEQDEDKLETESEQKLYFSFIASGAKDIVWDPKVGVISAATQEALNDLLNGDGSSLPGFEFWLTIISLFAFKLVMRKKNKDQ